MSPVSRSNWQDEHGLAVFFLTPSFAKWLHGDETFLKKALAHIYPPVESTARVQALVAVVDKLPVPQYLNLGLPNLDLVNQREQYPPVWDTGLEGVTYRTMSLADASRSVVRSTRDQKGTLSFISSGFHSRRVSSTKTLELPLANTVFQTGSTTTMALSSWEWGPESNFVRKEKSDLVHQAIHIYDSPPYPAFDPKMPNSLSTTSIPLVPLTIPRVVEASMGNILRRITGPDGESATASEELEQMVPQYFAARGLTPQSISVWALLIPHSETSFIEDQTASILQSSQLSNHLVKLSEPWQSLWSSNPPIWNDLGQQAISRGARLHRVISGGGGWGKKAGLLSLDPSINGLEHADSSTESFAEGPEDLSSALQEVVRPGDSIQFFASPIPDDALPADEDVLRKLDTDTAVDQACTVWGWEFGTVPSTVDAVPNSSWQHRNKSTSNQIYVTRNCFGALAEGGMTLRESRSDRLDGAESVEQTQVDVPFSRFSLAVFEHRDPATKVRESP
ncbi:hypothetical protein P154DRAFT_191386 [Amniculicola lignicola CBS 123094]|uniref:V-type c subunit family protein n=1 Tax=Amniculicola lignicola CBS 123094 TaxID=1392246 RepID=A0A6A5WJ39_9PLEO|nr:hypothetical protein P154DRAFT_191386 [Amniculicola lignicola CBS 123094]